MNKPTSAVLIIAILLCVISCKKENKISYYTRQTYLINTPIIPGEKDYPPIPLGQYAWGVMQTCIINGNYTTSSGNNVSVYSNNAWAYFHGAISLYVPSGNVFINNYELYISPNLYNTSLEPFYYDQFFIGNDSLSINNDDKWSVSGDSAVPTISYDYNADLPVFTGTLPSAISTSTDLSIKFDASNISNADSVIVVVYQENNSTNYSSTTSTNGGTAIVHTAGLIPAIIGDPNNNAIIEILSYRYIVQIFANRPYVFAKVNKTIRSVSVTN